MVNNIKSLYQKLLERNRNLTVLGTAQGILNWDMETMMPPKAVHMRSEQLSLLSEISHKMSTSPQIGKLLNIIRQNPQYDSLSEVEKRNILLIKKNYDEQTKLPTKLVAQIARQQTISVNTWKKAKAAKDYAKFKPELEKLVTLNMEAAEILMKAKHTETPYDALVDIYEPKMTSKEIAKIFVELEQGLKGVLSKIESAKNQPDTDILRNKVPIEKQKEVSKLLAQTLGYDITTPDAAGRLDETEHPFTTGYYDDLRITTHYYVDNLPSSIFSVLHETGHALYEQGLPQEWKYQPVGSPCSMGVHESQSRLHENLIGRSKEFWAPLLPKIKAITSPSFSNLDLNKFICAINRVNRSKIRIESDEVTYSLHIIIRFQIERELFAGKVKVSELPALWNQKYDEILGVRVENDSEGVMQDTHWASGMYGYFPSYALGNIYTGQMLSAIDKSNPNWRNELAQGNLNSIRNWLKSNIYCKGNLYDPADLIRRATGTELTVKPYLKYLQEKFKGLYGF